MTTITGRLLATIVLSSALLAGCGAVGVSTSAPAADERAGGAAGAPAEAPAGGAAAQPAKVPAATANPQSGPAGGSVTENRLLARTASITVQVDDVAAAAARLRVIAAGKGGIISAENIVIAERGSRPSTLVIVVPAERLDATLEEVGAVGTIKLRAINTTDVTTQVADVDARIRTQRESIARIQELLKRAGSVAEVAQVEGELTRRQADLESLLARQKALSAQVAESPITVTLVTPSTPVPDPVEDPSFWTGLKQGWKAFTSFIAVGLMVLGALLPFLVFFGLIGAAVWYVARRAAARRRMNRPDPVWPAPPPNGTVQPQPGPGGPAQQGTPGGAPQPPAD